MNGRLPKDLSSVQEDILFPIDLNLHTPLGYDIDSLSIISRLKYHIILVENNYLDRIRKGEFLLVGEASEQGHLVYGFSVCGILLQLHFLQRLLV